MRSGNVLQRRENFAHIVGAEEVPMNTITPFESATPIDMGRLTSVAYWSARFRVSSEQLLAAVDSVGPLAESVEQFLRSSPIVGISCPSGLPRSELEGAEVRE
jgi:hypothetical protein